MLKTKRKAQPPEPDEQLYRSLSVRANTFNTEDRSVEVVIASETPVPVFDRVRGEVVDEILLMDGIEFRNGKRQLPFVDTHDSKTVRSLLGSVRDIGIQGTELIGRAKFGSRGDAQSAYEDFRDGHLSDVSVGAKIIRQERVGRGETATFGGRSFKGPVNVVTRWTPLEVSAAVVGADPTATARSDVRMRAYQEPYELEKTHMDEAFRTLLLEKGMPEELAGPEAIAWGKEHLGRSAGDDTTSSAPPVTQRTEPSAPAPLTQADLEVATQRAIAAERGRQDAIRGIVRGLNLDNELADELIRSGANENDARKLAIDRHAATTKRTGVNSDRIEFGLDRSEKFAAAATDGLLERCFRNAGIQKSPFGEDRKPSDGYEQFARCGLSRLAEFCLEEAGINTRTLGKRDIVSIAMGNRDLAHRLGVSRASEGAAWHVSGSFSNLLLDASNKTLLAAYDEAPHTWSTWARQAPSVADFKNVNRIRFSESPDPELVPENHPYKEKAMSDAKESYKVEKYGAMFSVSWETVVNDDLDAISRVPAMHGNAMRRKQNGLVYSVLTSNPTMADGYALFATEHSNYVTSGAVPNVTTLNAMYLAMQLQTGLSGALINVMPRYLIVPPKLAATAYILVGSMADPAVGGSAVGNANVHNIYGPTGPRQLTVIVEPTLNAANADGWYGVADYRQIDTVELAFLEGEESPVLERETGFETDTYKFKIRQTMGAKAIDWRGMYYNDGA